MANGDTDQPDDTLSEETFVPEDLGSDDEVRPALEVAVKDRRLLTQPFDFIVGSLQEQVDDGQLVLQDDYQRRHVWDNRKSSRLIESLLLNVPVPVCYFAELEDGSYSVIDGQQRLTAIARYMTNLYPLSGLRVRPELNKKRYSELDQADKRIIRTRTIRCIVIQKESHPDIRFDVFERLNQGAVKLNPQELRNSTYRGDLNKVIRLLCNDKQFQRVRRVDDIDMRMGDAEMVLRFFAFHFSRSSYRGLYAPFLDQYLEANIHMSFHDKEAHEQTFRETISKVDAVFGRNAFRQIDDEGAFANQINRAVYDVIMLTFAHIEKTSLERMKVGIVTALQELCVSNPDFQDAIGRATRDKARINTRTRLWGDKLRSLGLPCPSLSYGT